ncbi:hypothetical protein MF271_19255 (plasmid) [Deinococcus sp. KNUC1210]|uniref:hypothetical protein n=1 Tax=Deinococcus sp. KNUC1210 TaxID=2917691 RepID=UPI001EF0B5D2|nr:hypothetical protein [Deinococcus sp. KNUC1210]ULH17329.1 hypothetical protein MF271_19255 [Deinococcus sp. KNUC1210]
MLCGLYQVAWAAPGAPAQQLARQRADLLTTANAGLSLFHTSHLGNLSMTRTLLDLAQARGVAVILEDVSVADMRTLGTHPALLAHSVADDANAKPLASVQALCSAQMLVPRYLSHGPSLRESHAELYGLAEIVGVQSYVFPAEQLLASYLVWTQARQNADAAGVRVFANSQLHSIGGERPTTEQIRAQVWVAAATGLDGLLGYTLLDGAGTLKPDLLTAFSAACAEVRWLASGRSANVLSDDRLTLTARWPAGVSVQLDLSEHARVVQLKRR